MVRKFLLGAFALAAAAGIFAATPAEAKGPTAGSAIATGLLSPRGLTMGPDGMLYVAEAGTGGDTVIEVDGAEHHVGNTGRISKIDPETGDRTTVVDDLPSDFGTTGDSVGAADVAFIGDTLYFLQTHGGEAYGFPGTPTGIYRLNDNGTVDLVADIGQFNFDNPVADITGGVQADIEPGGNPYAIVVRDGAFLVSDGNQNQLLRATVDGAIDRITEFPGHPVSTGIASSGSGAVYVGMLGPFPFAPEDGQVVQVAYPTGARSVVASGVSSITDVEFGPGGQLYALNFADQDIDFSSGTPFEPFSGKLMRVEGGEFVPVVAGLTFAGSVTFDGDTAYVSNNSVSIPGVFEGEIVKIEGVSSLPALEEPAPEPTTAPPAATPTRPAGGIRPPDTGTGPSGSASATPWLLALAVAGIGIAAAGAAVAARRQD